MSTFSRPPGHWDDDQSSHSDPPSTRSSNDPPEHASHIRSRSTALAQSPKRLSVFSGRSRSNTTTSTSSRRSPGSSMTSIDSSVPSLDERAPSALGMRSDKSDRVSRSFLARGSRILRRQGSKINIVATLDEEDELDRMPRAERRHRSRHVDHRKSDLHDYRNFISLLFVHFAVAISQLALPQPTGSTDMELDH